MKLFCLTLCTGLAALPAIAQDAESGDAGTVDRRDSTYLMSPEDIDVVTNDGEKIGEIEEILVDSQGVPAGFLIEFDGLHIFADGDVAVPLASLTYDGHNYISTMTEEQLKNLQPWDE